MTDNQPIENQITVINYTCQKCGHTWLMRMGVNPPEITVEETPADCIICTPVTFPGMEGKPQ